MTPDDGDVMGKAKGLDTTVFNTLYAEYKTPIYRFAYCLSRDKEEADELFQETWLRVVQYYPRTSRVRHFRTWVFAITANLHRDMLRKKRIRRLFFKEANRTHHDPVEKSVSKSICQNVTDVRTCKSICRTFNRGSRDGKDPTFRMIWTNKPV